MIEEIWRDYDLDEEPVLYFYEKGKGQFICKWTDFYQQLDYQF